MANRLIVRKYKNIYENLILDNTNGKEIAYMRKNIVTYVLVG